MRMRICTHRHACSFMAESAAQLFARLGAKQRLGTLGFPLFTSLPSLGGGLCPGDLVEVTGGEGSGKSEILLNIAAQCVLPRKWRGREIGGKEVEVVWVSTDHKLDLLRLVAILEGGICDNPYDTDEGSGRTATDGQLRSTQRLSSVYHSAAGHGSSVRARESVCEKDRESADYKALIMSCLSRLHVVHCSSSTELGLTLQSLRHSFLSAHPDVCALFMDNVAEFHWLDRAEAAGSLHGAQVKQSTWVSALRLLMEEHHLVAFAARPLLFTHTPGQRVSGQHGAGGGRSFHSEDVMCQEWKKMLKYRFILTATHTDGPPLRYTAQRVRPQSDTLHSFVVSSSGVIFSEGF